MTKREATKLALEIAIQLCSLEADSPTDLTDDILTEFGYGEKDQTKVLTALTALQHQLKNRLARLT